MVSRATAQGRIVPNHAPFMQDMACRDKPAKARKTTKLQALGPDFDRFPRFSVRRPPRLETCGLDHEIGQPLGSIEPSGRARGLGHGGEARRLSG